ncbi:hypothetical protein [Dokdonella sp.]|uniref:hypothetical protein n=1 Tax=Dokdonella sp. TaxID=2291710 RepID=UPI001B1AB43F|nr:hypothetical protein [Dokdonella sp.]MBO9661313.1 hypothetical protein [Dokdonella sp.]
MDGGDADGVAHSGSNDGAQFIELRAVGFSGPALRTRVLVVTSRSTTTGGLHPHRRALRPPGRPRQRAATRPLHEPCSHRPGALERAYRCANEAAAVFFALID